MIAKALTQAELQEALVLELVDRMAVHMQTTGGDMTDARILVESVLIAIVAKMERLGAPPETLDLICERAKERHAQLRLVAEAKGFFR